MAFTYKSKMLEAKAKLVWKYIKTEIKEWIQNAHMKKA